MTIIKEDCLKHHQQQQQYKRTINHINRTNFPRKFLRNLLDYYENI